jgi:hypothetical protein
MDVPQITTTYTIRCACCRNSCTWTNCASPEEAIQKTLESDWQKRADGYICFECVARETQKVVEK